MANIYIGGIICVTLVEVQYIKYITSIGIVVSHMKILLSIPYIEAMGPILVPVQFFE